MANKTMTLQSGDAQQFSICSHSGDITDVVFLAMPALCMSGWNISTTL